jgi:hypothetical protein
MWVEREKGRKIVVFAGVFMKFFHVSFAAICLKTGMLEGVTLWFLLIDSLLRLQRWRTIA